eukprot:CAMPEP_0196779100 /NCGR_PEP_ID=MMETSP1104-20130614/6179_1 /TAXON_ID=33652 /ORGANISM="Cafeteria sp., Strain Caron Lab Isolate" /LENGTH=677 /DNA_ID=CAMNT_0042149275 /DNA_START=242 /DNA_END=2272 /DNA_ORIENTATION=+
MLNKPAAGPPGIPTPGAGLRWRRRRDRTDFDLDLSAVSEWERVEELATDEREAVLLDAFHRRWRRSRTIRLVCMLITAISHFARLMGASLWLSDSADSLIGAGAIVDMLAVCLLVPTTALALRRELGWRQRVAWISMQYVTWACVTLSLVLHQIACSDLNDEEAARQPGGAATCRSIHANSIPVIPSTITFSFLVIGVVGLQLPAVPTSVVGVASDVALLSTGFAVGVDLDTENTRVLFSHAIVMGVIVLLLRTVQRNEQGLVVTHQQSTRQRYLERSQAIAKASVEAHKATLGYVMHELRNPIHVMAGALWIMRDSWPFPRKHELTHELSALERSVQTCKTLVDDVMDLRRLRDGRLAVRPQWTRVAGVVRDAVNQVARMSPVPVALRVDTATAELRGLLGDSDGLRGLVALLDPLRVKQVLLNGLTNAAKASNGAPFPVVVLLRHSCTMRVRAHQWTQTASTTRRRPLGRGATAEPSDTEAGAFTDPDTEEGEAEASGSRSGSASGSVVRRGSDRSGGRAGRAGRASHSGLFSASGSMISLRSLRGGHVLGLARARRRPKRRSTVTGLHRIAATPHGERVAADRRRVDPAAHGKPLRRLGSDPALLGEELEVALSLVPCEQCPRRRLQERMRQQRLEAGGEGLSDTLCHDESVAGSTATMGDSSVDTGTGTGTGT